MSHGFSGAVSNEFTHFSHTFWEKATTSHPNSVLCLLFLPLRFEVGKLLARASPEFVKTQFLPRMRPLEDRALAK